MLLSALALLPELVTFVSLFANVEYSFVSMLPLLSSLTIALAASSLVTIMATSFIS